MVLPLSSSISHHGMQKRTAIASPSLLSPKRAEKMTVKEEEDREMALSHQAIFYKSAHGTSTCDVC